MFFCEYCEILKNSFFLVDLLSMPFRNFYLMIDNWYFRVMFYYCKIRPPNRKNFAIARSKLVFRYLTIFLLQVFVSSTNCKEKLVVLNWTILVSNFSFKSSKSNLRTLPKVKMMKNKNGANDRINMTNIDLTFSYIKLSLKLLEFKWEKVTILQLLLTPRA